MAKSKGKQHRRRRTIKRGSLQRFGGGNNAIFTNPARLKYLNLGYLLPARIRVKLPYYEYVNLNTSSGTNYGEMILRANSLFDPLYSGGNRNLQSPLYDTLSTMYNRYNVKACGVTIAVNSALSNFAGKLCVHANVSSTSDTTTYSDNPYQLFSQPNTRIMYCRNVDSGGATSSTRMYRTTKAMFPLFPNDKDMSALTSSDPVLSWYYHITIWDVNNDTSTGIVVAALDVKMIQDVEFGDISEVTES